MRYPLWAIRAQLEDEPLHLRFDNAAELGLDPSDLVADNQAPCRALAEAFRADGPSAFTAPSAALPGTTNLIVLEPRVLVSFNQTPIDDIDWPGSMASQDGRCPEGLWELVQYRSAGRKHPGLAAWEAGDTLQFEEPPVSAAALTP
jgi:hypothetical protein